MQPTQVLLHNGGTCIKARKCINMGRCCSCQRVDTVGDGVPTNQDESLYKVQIFLFQRGVIYTVKHIFHKTTLAVHVYKSPKSLLKLKVKMGD